MRISDWSSGVCSSDLVLDMPVAAEVLRVFRVGTRHHVPTRPALADPIERGITTRDAERLVVGGGGGRDEADTRGGSGERGQQADRLDHDRPGDRVAAEKRGIFDPVDAVSIGADQPITL